jgi:hypothetical protein
MPLALGHILDQFHELELIGPRRVRKDIHPVSRACLA